MADSPMTPYLQRNSEDEGPAAISAGTGSLHRGEENVSREYEPDKIAETLDHIPTGEEADDDEDSVEQYMAEFLKRYKIASDSLETPADKGPVDLRELALESTEYQGHKPSTGPVPKRNASAAVTRPAKPQTLVERTVAPESPDDIQALRQLANSSARGALETHSSKKLIFWVFTQLLISIVSMFCCLVFLAMASQVRSVAYFCAVVSLVVAAVFCRRFLVLTRNLPSSATTLTTGR